MTSKPREHYHDRSNTIVNEGGTNETSKDNGQSSEKLISATLSVIVSSIQLELPESGADLLDSWGARSPFKRRKISFLRSVFQLT